MPALRLVAVCALLAGCEALEPDCDVHPRVEARDTTVAAYDTVRITAGSRDACGEALRYLWSFDGGETYDTTATAYLTRVFTRADAGAVRLRIRALTSRGTVSPATEITIRVEERLFAYRLPADTIFYFADTLVAVDLAPADPIDGIDRYVLTDGAYPARSDTSRASLFRVPMPRGFHHSETRTAQVLRASGERSATVTVVLKARPRLLGSLDLAYYRAALLGEASVRILLPVRAASADRNPHTGLGVINPRVIEMGLDGAILQDRLLRSPREILVGSLDILDGGTGLVLGRDDIVPNREDVYVAALDRAGGALWEKVIDLDTGYTRGLRAFPGDGGGYLILAASSASEARSDGKPPARYATRFHFVALGADGSHAATRSVLVPGIEVSLLHADRMRDGSVIVAGVRRDSALGDRAELQLLRFDAAGGLEWSRTFRSELGSSSPRSLHALGDGTILITGRDGGTAQSHWILRLDGQGNQDAYRLQVLPKGYSPNGMALGARGSLLQLLNGEAGGLILASDMDGNELWRRSVVRDYRAAYLELAVSLPDGGFLVFGSLYPGANPGQDGDAFACRITADGDFLW